jgi:hypothetical protein
LKNIWKNSLKPKAIILAKEDADNIANVIAFGFNAFFHIFFKPNNTYFPNVFSESLKIPFPLISLYLFQHQKLSVCNIIVYFCLV